MPTARYFIVHDQIQDEWHIKYGNEEYGPYKTQDEAMVFAVDAAQADTSFHGRFLGRCVCIMCRWLMRTDPSNWIQWYYSLELRDMHIPQMQA
jgi:hypothetical protein